MTLMDQFLFQFRIARRTRLMTIDILFDRALKDDDAEEIAALRAERRMLLDFPATVIDGDRAELVAQWPEDFAGLPEWFSDPESVEDVGEPLVIDCSGEIAV